MLQINKKIKNRFKTSKEIKENFDLIEKLNKIYQKILNFLKYIFYKSKIKSKSNTIILRYFKKKINSYI